MDLGFLTTGLLTGLREGVEAALIVSIILAYLAKTGNQRHFGRIWLGAGAAIALSVVVGVDPVGHHRRLRGAPPSRSSRASTMLLAAAVVTWMLFWMRRTSANIKGELQAGVDRALVQGGIFGLAVLAFTAVIREGIETSLFLLGPGHRCLRGNAGATSTLVGAFIGLVDRGRHRLRLLRRRAGHQPADLLPLDRHRADLHRRRPAAHARPRVHRGRRDHVRDRRPRSTSAAVLPHEPDAETGPGVVGSAAAGAVRLHQHAGVGRPSSPGSAYVVVVLTLYLRPIKPGAEPASTRAARSQPTARRSA